MTSNYQNAVHLWSLRAITIIKIPDVCKCARLVLKVCGLWFYFCFESRGQKKNPHGWIREGMVCKARLQRVCDSWLNRNGWFLIDLFHVLLAGLPMCITSDRDTVTSKVYQQQQEYWGDSEICDDRCASWYNVFLYLLGFDFFSEYALTNSNPAL